MPQVAEPILRQILKGLKARHLDHGFYVIDVRTARRLNNGRLPRCGYESLVECDGQHFWLARTPDQGEVVWSIRTTDWILRDGRAVLTSEK